MEHVRLQEINSDYWNQVLLRRNLALTRFKEISGAECEMIHYTDFGKNAVGRLAPDLIIFSGHNTDISFYGDEHLETISEYFRKPAYPTFTICGSFQLMAQTHGVEIGPIGTLDKRHPVSTDPILPDDMISENGFCSVQIEAPKGSLFNGLQSAITVHQHHFWEVKSVPSDFLLRGSSHLCKIQALEHRVLPLAGVQFHPEDYTDEHADGRRLLERIFEWSKKVSTCI